MKTELESRLEELKKEYSKGKEKLATLDQESHNVRNTLLRISGAIQVLEELLENNKQIEPSIIESDTFQPENNQIEVNSLN